MIQRQVPNSIWPNGGLRLATDINCVIRILAERSLVQPTELQNRARPMAARLKILAQLSVYTNGILSTLTYTEH